MTIARLMQMAAGAGGGAPLEIAYVTSGKSNSNTQVNTYTFSGVSIGAADAARRVIVAIGVQDGSNSYDLLDSVTVGGVPATIHTNILAGTMDRGPVAIVSAPVPIGTTADIVINHPAAAGTTYAGHVYAVYRALNCSGTPYDAQIAAFAAGSLDRSITADTGVGTITIGAVGNDATETTGLSWTAGMDTTDATVATANSNRGYFGFGMYSSSSVESARTFTATYPSGATDKGSITAVTFQQGSSVSPIVTWGANSNDAANQTTYTFASVSTPDAATGRYVVPFCLYDAGSSSLRTISSITYESVSQTVYSPSSVVCPIGACIVQDDAGTTASISFSGSSSGGTNGVAQCFIINGVSSAAYSDFAGTGSGASSALTVNVTIPANSLVLAYAHNNASPSMDFTWSGDVSLTEAFNEGFQGTATVGGAYGFFETAQGACDITCTFGTSDRCSLSVLVLTLT